jgi:serine/threonine protein kinase
MLTKLGKYEIRGELGSGAMGIVYWAEDPRLGRSVALKTTSPEVARNPELLKRFYREAQAAAQLRHPNIVTIYDIDEAEGIPFIAMEFLEGEDLEKAISARREMPIIKKLNIVTEICRGLHYAHQHGVVHRDVKPGNIVVLPDGQVKIVDFGIARVGASSMTRTGIVLGTVLYMSPEQVQGQTVDARSDIFSAGIILYELLTYQTPFAGDDVPSILYKILNQPPEPVTKFLPQCPPQLEKVVHRALMKNREERYQTAEDMVFDLQHVADTLKRDMVGEYLEQGERCWKEGNLTVAKESLQKVLEVDSSHELAKNLLAQVQEHIFARQRAQKVEEGLHHAKEALQTEQYVDAVGLLEEVLRLDPKHEEALQLKRQAVEQRERAEKIRRHLERAERLAAEVDFQRAKAELEAVLAIDAKNSAALKMMDWVLRETTAQERQRQVRQYLESARAHVAEKNFAKALGVLDKARELDAVNLEVDALTRLVRSNQEKEERRVLLTQRLAEIEETLGRQQLDQALARATQTLQEFPDDPQLLKLHGQIAHRVETQKKRRYVEEQLQAARELLKKNEYASALAILEKATQADPDDARLSSFLKTVRESQEQAALESLRKEAIREANEQIHAQNLAGAIETLQKGVARAGQSPEMNELLQFARERHAEQQKTERARQLLKRAQGLLLDEEFEEAIAVLERGQAELKSGEMDDFLAAIRQQWQAFQQRREEIVTRALGLIQSGDASRAMAQFEGVPKVFFKNAEFQRVYAQCRQSLDRTTFLRNAREQIEKCIAEEDLAAAESLLEQALKPYPDEPALLGLQKRLHEEELRLRQLHWGKLLEEAQVALGRMEYKRAIELLSSVPWESSELPELSAQAKSLLEEAQRRGREAGLPQLELRPRAKRTAVGAVSQGVLARPESRTRLALWAALGVFVLALVGIGTWRYLASNPNASGYLQLTAAPWAQVVSVRTARGDRLNITGETPLQMALPPGQYVIELKNGEATGKLNVAVESGKVSSVNYTFPQVKIDDLVRDLVSHY